MGELSNTVIFVDKEQTNRSFASRCLTRSGISVITAADGNECMDLVLQKRAQLVVTDLRIPKLSGRELLSHLRECSPDTPVILASEFNGNDEILAAWNEGALCFLKKPLDCNELVLVVTRALKRMEERRRCLEENEMLLRELQVQKEHAEKMEKLLLWQATKTEAEKERVEEEKDSLVARVQKQRALIDKAPIGIFTVNGVGRIMEANAAVSVNLGLIGVATLVGSNIRDHAVLVRSGLAKRILDCLEEGKEIVYSARFQHVNNNGDYRVVKCHFSAIDTDKAAREVLVIIDDVTREAQYQARQEKLAYYDETTGLINQNKFDYALDEQVEKARTENMRLALAQLDVDFFKTINDTYQHEFGTKVLAAIGGRIRASIKDSQDVGIRYGGDEFVVIYTGYSKGTLKRIVERLSADLSKPYFFPDPERGFVRLECTFSIGVAELSDQTPRDLYRDADRATYRAKENGRNQIVFIGCEEVAG